MLSQERERERLDRERRRSEREAALATVSAPVTAGGEANDENQMDVDKPIGSETNPAFSSVEEEDIPTCESASHFQSGAH